MKNITKILSLVLVFALLALALVSCGEKPEDRVAKAMAKMATAKQTDSEVTITVKMDIAGTKTEIPMTMKVQSDMTDEKNPVVYTETNTTVMGQSTKIVSFYKDGYVYALGSDKHVHSNNKALVYKEFPKAAKILSKYADTINSRSLALIGQ